MRNLAQFPLSADEAHQALARQVQAIAEQQTIGGMDAYVLVCIGEFLRQHDAQFRDFLERSAP
jgi:hypothetical protein